MAGISTEEERLEAPEVSENPNSGGGHHLRTRSDLHHKSFLLPAVHPDLFKGYDHRERSHSEANLPMSQGSLNSTLPKNFKTPSSTSKSRRFRFWQRSKGNGDEEDCSTPGGPVSAKKPPRIKKTSVANAPEFPGLFNVEKLTADERLSRFLHSKKCKTSISETNSFFEHFLVIGLDNDKIREYIGQNYKDQVIGYEPKQKQKQKTKSSSSPSSLSLVENTIVTPKSVPSSCITSKILFQYPHDIPLQAPGIRDFCFPDGIKADIIDNETTPVKGSKGKGKSSFRPDQKPFVFLLTGEKGDNRYGISVFSEVMTTIDLKNAGFGESSSVNPGEDEEECNNIKDITFHSLVCFCIISKLPFFPLHVEVLKSIMDIPYVCDFKWEDHAVLREIERDIQGQLQKVVRPGFSPSSGVPATDIRGTRNPRRRSRLITSDTSSPFSNSSNSSSTNTSPEQDTGGGTGTPGYSSHDLAACNEGLLSLNRLKLMNIQKAFKILLTYQISQIPKEGERLDLFVMTRSQPLTFIRPDYDDEEEMLAAWGLPMHLHFLSVKHTLFIFLAVLLEKKIVLVSEDPRIVSAIVLSFLPLIRPFSYQSAVIPILPTKMMNFLQAPCPLLVGMLSFPEGFEKMEDVLFFDIEHPYNKHRDYHLPALPKEHFLTMSMKKLYKQYFLTNVRKKSDPPFDPTYSELSFVKVFCGMFESYFSNFFSEFASNCISDLTSVNETISVFIRESFIEGIPLEDRPFFRLFLETGIFNVYSDDLLQKLDKRKSDYHFKCDSDMYKTL